MIDYVSTFVPKASGEHFNPHVTTGVAPREYLDKMLAEPFEPYVPIDQARTFMTSALDALPALTRAVDQQADLLAALLRDAHRRVREAAGVIRRGLNVAAQKPADVLGVYVYLPIPGSGAA